MIAKGMQQAVDGIVSSRAARKGDLRRIKATVHKVLADGRNSRRVQQAQRSETKRTMRIALVAGRAGLKGDVGSLRQEVASALGATRQRRLAQAQELKGQLSSGAQAARTQVHQMLAQEQQQRLGAAARLGDQRRKSINAIDSEIQAIRGAAQTTVRAARADRRGKIRASLQRLSRQFAAIRAASGQGRFAAKRECSTIRADLAETRAQWQRGLQQAAPPRTVGISSPPVAKAAPPAPKLEVTAEAAKAPAISQPAARETMPSEPQAKEEEAKEAVDEGLVKKIFDHVANHPDGVRAREMEDRFGANRFQVMRALRTLLEEGKVRREDGVYFAR